MIESMKIIHQKMIEKYGAENVTVVEDQIFVIDEEGESHRIWLETSKAKRMEELQNKMNEAFKNDKSHTKRLSEN